MRNYSKSFFIVLVSLLFMACGSPVDGPEDKVIEVAAALTAIDISTSPNGVVLIPESVPAVINDIFMKYTRTLAPNGKPIHLLAQDVWTEEQICKARNVLEHLLRDYPGSEYGSDKSKVANSMADRSATMVLFNTPAELEKAFSESELRYVDLSMQDLRANENPAEGDADYMSHITRDASFEEIWHLVHDNGVKPTLPDMIAEMRAANDAAAAKGWRAWPDDEPDEHPNEYVGVLLDNYYDLWAKRPKLYEGREITPEDLPKGKTHFGRYFANSRKKLAEMDLPGYLLVEKFFHPYLTYTPHLPVDFTGTFSLQFDREQAYTYKSQHLVNVVLTGNEDANLTGNAFNNNLVGNDGPNILTGGPGDDTLDGGAGTDGAAFSGSLTDYSVTYSGSSVIVQDKRENGDGRDTLISIELLRFADKTVPVKQQ